MNPERPWPSLERLKDLTAQCGFELKARLTVHPEYVRQGEPWLDPRISAHVAALAVHDGPDAGLAKPGVRPTGLPWQEPDGGFASVGRTDLFEAIDAEGPDGGRTDDRRSDFADVYGDWASVKDAAATTGTPAVLHSEGREALAAAEADPGNLSDEHALTLMTAEGPLLEHVVRLADHLRRDTVGEDVTYVVNRNINFTNVCYVGCRFCAFAQRRTDADAYSLSLDEVADRARRRGTSARRRSACKAASTPSSPRRRTSTS